MEQGQREWQTWCRGLAEGDNQVAAEFWNRYGGRLHRLAQKNLAGRLQQRLGPEDVVQSVCRTFFRRIKAGEFKFDDSDSLWRLLCAITLTKIRLNVRFHLRQKRGVDQEQSIEAASDYSRAPMHQLRAHEPSADELVEFEEQLENLLSGLDIEEQQMVELKLQHCTNHEIAQHLGCSERTVRRILKRIQSRLRQMLVEDLPA
jgi:RNA polymerase sigma factor (sigma-70 family)